MAQSNYGTVYTGKEIAKQLRQKDRDMYGRLTWGGLEGSATAQYAQQESMLSRSYQEATASAYDTYLKNKRAIENSTLIGESKQNALLEQRNALEQAYQSYEQSYVENQQKLKTNYATQLSDIEDALLQQGEMTAKYANYHGDYYNYLTENYSDEIAKSKGSKIWNEKFWNAEESRYFTWEELKPKMYDKDRNLTMFGIDTLDQLENQQLGQEGITTWGDFLAQTDADVLDWAESYNPYNFTIGGSNAATFKTMTGRVSTDWEYSFLERFGGLSSEQVDNLFKPFNDTINKIQSYDDSDKKDDAKDIMSDFSSSIDNLNSLAESLGIDKELNKELTSIGIKDGLKGLSSAIKEYSKNVKDKGQMASDWFSTFFTGIMGAGVSAGSTLYVEKTAEAAAAASSKLLNGMKTGLSAGANAAGTASKAVPIVGAIVTMLQIATGITGASIRTDQQRDLNKQMVNEATNAYKSAMNQIVMFAHDRQQKAEQKFLAGII